MSSPKSPIENSRRNNPYYCSEYKQVKLAVDELYDVYKAYKKRTSKSRNYSIRSSDIDKIKRHIENVVLDLYSAWHGDPTKSIGYSRDEKHFKRKQPKWKSGGSYYDYLNKKPLLSKTFFLSAIDFLIDGDYVSSETAPSYKETAKAKLPRSKFSSRIRAKEKLIELLHHHGVNWAAIQTDLNRSFIVLRDEKRKPIPYDPDTNLPIVEMNERLQKLNEIYDLLYVDLNIPEDELKALRKRLASTRSDIDEEDDGKQIDDDDVYDPEEFREPFELNNRILKRKFINDFDTGGRFYGGWWQGCPSELRKHITIQGRVTAEADFSTIQPRILYTEKGLPVPDDSYLVDGWDKQYRDIYKKAFNQLINSKPKVKNNLSLLSPDLKPKTLPAGWDDMNKNKKKKHQLAEFKRLTGREYTELLTDLIAYHDPIKNYFFSQSWKWLQRIDSDIAELVIFKLVGENIPALPIHDSFIVPLDDKLNNLVELRKAMEQAFEDVMGVKCKIDTKEIVNTDEYKASVMNVPADHFRYKLNYIEWTSIRSND